LSDQGNCLSIDLCLGACVVVVGPREGPPARVIAQPMARGRHEEIAPLVRQALTDARLAVCDLTRIGATVGPGSFTGLRVGLAFVRAFAMARAIECVGVSTLEVLAAEAPPWGLTLTAIRSRGDLYYVQLFRDGVPTTAPDVLGRDEIAARILEIGGGDAVTLIGPEVEELLDLAPGSKTLVRGHVSGAVLHQKVCNVLPGAPPRPLYMRAPDARTLVERQSDG
jgi:tRNA threonylcarbamoyladenosine biosynthesis protein TsaB